MLSERVVHLFSFRSSVKEPPKEDLTVSEKFQLVLDVAQKAQVYLRFLLLLLVVVVDVECLLKLNLFSLYSYCELSHIIIFCGLHFRRIFLERWQMFWRKSKSE